MKISTYLFFTLLGVAAAFGQSAGDRKDDPAQARHVDNRSVEQQIIEIEKQWSQAFVRRDPTALERHVADDYAGIYPTRKLTKADLIAGAKGAGNRTILSSLTPTDAKVRVFDKTAVVTGHAVHCLREKGGEITVMRTLYTEVFILKDGRWQCVAGHYTPLAGPEEKFCAQ